MRKIPSTAKIPIILNGEALPVADVVAKYNKVYNLRDTLHEKQRLAP